MPDILWYTPKIALLDAPLEAIRPLAEEAGIDPYLYLFEVTLSIELPEKITKKTNPITLYRSVGILGEVPVHATESLEAVKHGLSGVIAANSKNNTPAEVARLLHRGLKIGYLNDTKDMQESTYPWIAGQRGIGQVLESMFES